MTIEALAQKLADLEQKVSGLQQRRVYQRDVMPSAIKQEHIEGIIIFRGLLSARPTNGKTEIQAYYATDNDTLYIWNPVSEAWKSEVFS